LTRLELQILIRGIDTFSGEDQFPDCLPEWQKLWAAIEPAAPAERTVEFADRYGAFVSAIDQLADIRAALFARLVPESTAEQRHALVSLMRAFDAIKMCSYLDTTAFKQLWFLQISMHSARAAGMEF
jgi:hypothetical protein